MSAENVIINFTSDTSDLAQVSTGLEEIIQKDEELSAVSKRLGEVMDKSNKASLDSTAKLAKSIEQLAASSKTLDKSVIGGAYRQYLKEIQSQLGLTQKELVKYVENARKAAQANIITAEDTQQADEFRLSVEIMNETLAEFEAEADKASESTKSLKAQLREARNELAAMAEAGLAGTPAFEELRQKAGELDDQIKDINQTIANTGSDTKNLDGLIGVASGVAGGFAVAQGTVALFGDENEELQKALLKVNAAMAILQGLQQVSAVLQKESSASLFINNLLRRQQTTATVAQAAAEQGATVATTAATTATKGFSAAIAANPVGLLVIGLTAAVIALSSFGDETDSETEKLEAMRQKAEELYEAIQKISNVNQLRIDRDIAIAQNEEEIKLLEIKGGEEKKISDLKLKNISLTRQNLQIELDNIDAAKKLTDDKTQFTQREFEIKKQLYQLDQQNLRIQIETNQALAARDAKNRSALADAEVAKAKLAILENEIDSIDSIKRVNDAEIQAIKRKRDEQLKSRDLTPGEQAKIVADANLAIAEKEKDLQQKLIAIDKSGVDARVKLAQKGSEEEYQAKLAQLEIIRKQELANAEVTKKDKLKIEADYIAGKRELDRQFQEQKIQDEISYLNSYIDEFGITEDRKLELTIRRLDRQRDLEISQAEENAAKIAEINAKYDAQIIEAKKAAIEKQLQNQLRALDVFGKQIQDRNLRIATDEKNSAQERILANNAVFNQQKQKLDAELAANKKLLEDKLISQEEYNLRYADYENRLTEITQQQTDRRTNIIRTQIERQQAVINGVIDTLQAGIGSVLDEGAAKTALLGISELYQQIVDIKNQDISDEEKRMAIISASIATAQQVVGQLFADARAQRQQALQEELASLDEAKNRELNNKNLTEQQKSDIEKKYNEQAKGAKRQAFIADKEAKKQEAVINGALAVIKAFPNFILMGIAAATTAITVAKIDSTPVPRFRRGKVQIEGPGTNTSDSIPAMISKGESVINADATTRWKQALVAINENKFEDYLIDYMGKFKAPKGPESIVAGHKFPVDYERLADAIAKRIPEPTYVKNVMDKDGLKTFIERSGGVNQILNETLRVQ